MFTFALGVHVITGGTKQSYDYCRSNMRPLQRAPYVPRIIRTPAFGAADVPPAITHKYGGTQ